MSSADDIVFGAPDGPAAFRLQVRTARELCAEPELPGAEQLLGPVLLRGSRTIIGGHTGKGKTTFGYALVSAYVRATDFLGWTGAGGRALIIDLEQGERTARKRLREAGLEHSDDVDMVLVADGLAIDTEPGQRAELERVFGEGGYGVVLLDPHYKAHKGDANEEVQVKALMGHLDRWRAVYKFALILPTHARKPPSTGAGRPTIHDIAAGSGAIVRGAEVVLAVDIAKPGVTHLYAFKHRDGDDELPLHTDPWTLSFSRDHGYRRIDTTTGPRKAPADAIAIWIRAQGGRATPGEIRDHFEITESTLRSRREELAESGIDYRGQGKDAEYLDHDVYPAITPHPAPRDESRGHDFAGSTDATKRHPDPAPRDPAIQPAAGSGKRSEQGKDLTPHPALPKGSDPPPAGSGSHLTEDDIEDLLNRHADITENGDGALAHDVDPDASPAKATT